MWKLQSPAVAAKLRSQAVAGEITLDLHILVALEGLRVLTHQRLRLLLGGLLGCELRAFVELFDLPDQTRPPTFPDAKKPGWTAPQPPRQMLGLHRAVIARLVQLKDFDRSCWTHV